jgi:hypothetical protein
MHQLYKQITFNIGKKKESMQTAGTSLLGIIKALIPSFCQYSEWLVRAIGRPHCGLQSMLHYSLNQKLIQRKLTF